MLITPSLYESYYYYVNSDLKTTEDFLKVLRKEETEKTQAMLNGIKFENEIRDICEGRQSFQEGTSYETISNIVKGGFWQERVKKPFGNYLLYGVCDVIKDDTIYDVKYCSGTYEDGKYNHSIQHLVYMYCTGMPRFQYLISKYDYKETYIEEHSWSIDGENELKAKIFELVSFLEGNAEFSKAFHEYWEAKDETGD